MQLVERESEAFWDKDFQAYDDFWAHVDYSRTIGWWAAGGTVGSRLEQSLISAIKTSIVIQLCEDVYQISPP